MQCNLGHMCVTIDITLREMVTWQGVKHKKNYLKINLTGGSASSAYVACARGKFDGSM